MTDRPMTPADPGDERDPVVEAALRTLAPPPHRPGFWDTLDDRLAGQAKPGVAPPPPLPPPEPPMVEEEAPLAQVIPLARTRRPRPQALLAAAAAALVVVVAAATLLSSSNTDVETRPAEQTTVPVEPPTSVDTAPAPDPGPAPSTTATTLTVGGQVTVAPRTTRSTTASTAGPTTTTMAKPSTLILSSSGLGRLKLGMPTSQAAATGAVGPYRASDGGPCGFAQPAGSYRSGDFSALFLNDRLARIYVQGGSRLRTPQGIGYGSPSSRLTEIPGVRTEAPEPYGAGIDVTIMNGSVGYKFNVQAPADDVGSGIIRDWSVGTKEGLALTEACS